MTQRRDKTQILSADELDELARQFDHAESVRAVILIGSYARGDAGPFSDVDLVRFVRSNSSLSSDDDRTHLHPRRILINLTSYRDEDVERSRSNIASGGQGKDDHTLAFLRSHSMVRKNSNDYVLFER